MPLAYTWRSRDTSPKQPIVNQHADSPLRVVCQCRRTAQSDPGLFVGEGALDDQDGQHYVSEGELAKSLGILPNDTFRFLVS
jgi:hypothetical protein